MTKEQALELEFKRGYYLAVANIINTHKNDVVAEDVLNAYGEVNFTGIDPTDVKTLKPLAAELKRKRRL